MTRLSVLGANAKLADRMAAVPGHDVKSITADAVEVEGAAEVLDRVLGHDDGRADLVVLGDELALDFALNVAQTIDRTMPGTGLVLVAHPDTDVALRAMRAGVREIIEPSVGDDELAAVLYRASQTVAPAAAAEASAAMAHDGHVIVVGSPKGGVGKSTIATNLAVSLAQQRPMDVVLVDLDAQFGDVATLLDLEPSNSVSDAIDSIAASDSVLLKTFLTPHSSGLLILAGAPSPADGDRIRADDARDLIRLLSTLFPVVVVDTAAGMAGATLGALEAADELVLVTTMEVTSLRAVAKEIEVLDQLGLAKSSRHLVLNLTGRKSGLSTRDVEASVGMSVSTTLLQTEEALLAANQGQPLVLHKKPGPMAKALIALAGRLIPVGAAPTSGRRKQARLKKTRGGGRA
ncbi:AAA family ATPase [Aeromicrobium terrae]|uniref:MinD/ParA family protein n=1 Tax=Aeromicrobium terrae TaxID=2498846 RepID=A0A5C8NMT0_9ACTN|nr:P-loop NTPase [Aeromicrobium terrae]TXL62131.1 MinD/ParA family protein [Aeromicrobium terrae]